jgi:valyl-tRNA synthetase
VRDAEGQKMSKSKGNVLDPIDIIDGIELDALVEKRTAGMMQPHLAKKIEQATRKDFPNGIQSYGTDALRFTFASLASTGRDIRFDLARTEGYRNFCNKLWNAARFVLMNVSEDREQKTEDGNLSSVFSPPSPDRWITARLHQVIAATSHAIDNYRFDLAAQAIYDFTWNEYCDWYLELAKISLQADDATLQRGTRKTLLTILETLLRLAHPIIPFITEEIWQRVAPLAGIHADDCMDAGGRAMHGAIAGTIMLQPYPVADEDACDDNAIAEISWVMNFILGVRRIRGEMNIAPGKPLPVLLQNGSATDRDSLTNNRIYLQKLGRLESITWLNNDDATPESAIALVGEMKILIPMAGLIDKTAELARLEKEIQKIKNDLPRVEGKLGNPTFVDKAPPEIINKEKTRLANLYTMLNNLEQQQSKIMAL